MSNQQRERLLEQIFAKGSAKGSGTSGQRIDPAVLSDIIAGLVFAQRPINSAGKEATERLDLGPRGTFILSLVNRGVRYPKDLAMVLQVGRSLISSELSRLTEAGLIATTAGDDRRRSELSLTAAGEAVNTAVRARLVAKLELGLSDYSADQAQLFARMLRDVGRVSPD